MARHKHKVVELEWARRIERMTDAERAELRESVRYMGGIRLDLQGQAKISAMRTYDESIRINIGMPKRLRRA